MRRLGLALVPLVLLAACTPDAQTRAHDTDATRAREAAVARLLSTLDAVAPLGQSLGELRDDTCDPGQHNTKVDSPYRLRCGIRIARIMPAAESTVEDAVAGLRARLSAAGCSPDGLVADTVARDLAAGRSLGMVGTPCGDVQVQVGILANQRTANGWNSSQWPPPNGFTVSHTPIDEAALARGLAHLPVTWWIEASQRYVDDPR